MKPHQKYYLAFKCVRDNYRSAFVHPQSPASVQYTVGKKIVYPEGMNGYLAGVSMIPGCHPLFCHLETGCFGHWSRIMVVKLPQAALNGVPPFLSFINSDNIYHTIESIQHEIEGRISHEYMGASSLTVLEEVEDASEVPVKDALKRYARKYHLSWVPKYPKWRA